MLVGAFVAAVVAAPATASAQDKVPASGEFGGKNGHAASGGVSVVKGSSGIQVVLDSEFKFDGAPDPKLGFGTNGHVESTQFSALKSNSGEQTYDVPTTIDPAGDTEV